MKQVYRVTSDGFFVEDVHLADNAPVPSDCVVQQSPQGFNWPKWTGTRGKNATGSWGEGGGIWHKQADGKVDPSKRYDDVTLPDGSKIRRGVDNLLVKTPKL